MASNPHPTTNRPNPDLYATHTRFALELEFVQSLSNPLYTHHLATLKLLSNPSFIAYLSYLQYFAQPEYVRFLQYPGPTLRMLELLQEEGFRRDMLVPGKVEEVRGEMVRAAMEGYGG